MFFAETIGHVFIKVTKCSEILKTISVGGEQSSEQIILSD